MSINFTGLKAVLKSFDEHGWKGSLSRGDWQIGNGGYNCWFELYYRGNPVARCVDGQLDCGFPLEAQDKEKLAHKILEVYDHLRFDEEKTVDNLLADATCRSCAANTDVFTKNDIDFEKE